MSSLNKYYPQFLLLILAFTFFTRMYKLHVPEKYIFDEVYHAVTAKLISRGDERAYDWHAPPPEPNTAIDWLHPPYAKYTQAFSMLIFGETSFGWRFSSVIFGCLVVFLTAKIAEELFGDKTLALMAGFLVSLDGLVFAMSRIAMNDIHVTAFILLSIFLYLRFRKLKRKEKKFLILSGLSAGLAVGTKWSGIFAIGILGLFEAVFIIKEFVLQKNRFRKKYLIKFFGKVGLAITSLIIIPAIMYLLSYSQMFLLGNNFNRLIEMHKNTWWYQTNLTATHPAQSKPIQWFLNTKPVWLAVDYSVEGRRGDIYAVGNPLLFWLANLGILASLVAVIYLKIIKFKKKKYKNKTQASDSLALLILIYFALWIPWQLSPRIMFFYHYLPAVPFLVINLAFWLREILKNKKFWLVTPIAIVAIFINFAIWYPHLTLIPVSPEFKNDVYFFFDFWKQG